MRIAFGNDSYNVKVDLRFYGNGNLAVLLVSRDGTETIAKLSVNVDKLPPYEFVLNHDLTALLSPTALERLRVDGRFEDTGKRVDYGFVKAQPIWRLAKV